MLPLQKTETIATEIGVNHPKNIALQNSMIMTTDFLITSIDNNSKVLKARSIKYQNELTKQRIKEKLAIERLYWETQNIEWKIVTENSFDREKAKRIKHLLGHYKNPFANTYSKDFTTNITHDLLICLDEQRNERIKDICLQLDRRNNIPDGSTLSLFFHLACRKSIPIKIECDFRASTKVSDYICTNKMSEIINKGVFNLAVS